VNSADVKIDVFGIWSAPVWANHILRCAERRVSLECHESQEGVTTEISM
jgi:hypothetical protein